MTEPVNPESPPPARKRGLFYHRDFRRLWIGDAVSQIGSQVSMLALPLVAVKTLHATAFEVGVLAACETAAFLLVGLPAGAWCDRVRRRPILIAGDIGRALVLGSVPIAALMHRLTIGQLFIVALLTGVLTVFFDVAYQSYLPELVTNEELVEGNAKLEATRGVAAVTGPSVGGFLVQAFTAPYAVLVDAVSFLWSASWVTAIRAVEPQAGQAAAATPRQRDRRRAAVRLQQSDPAQDRWVHRHREPVQQCQLRGHDRLLRPTVHLSAGGIGLLFSIGSIGGLVGALCSGYLMRKVGQARLIWVSAIIFAPPDLLLPLTHHDARLIFAGVALFAASVGATVYNVAQVSFRQALCPRPLLGRMNATMRFLVWGTQPIGGLLGGWLATTVGLRDALWIAAACSQVAPLWVIFSPLRGMRDLPMETQPE